MISSSFAAETLHAVMLRTTNPSAITSILLLNTFTGFSPTVMD
ncbi:MAG: hypothetical protein P8126_03555 [Gammaproteobacteria bacterium]